MSHPPAAAPAETSALSPARIGIVGAGSMGAQIAALCLSKDLDVVLWSRRDPPDAMAGVTRVLSRYAPDVDSIAASARLTCTQVPDPLAQADFVIESIIESLPAKHACLATLDGICSAATPFATNTSVLGRDVFSALPAARRAQTLGLHFFNPVFRMDLVEINTHPDTSAQARAAADALVTRLGKRALHLHDIHGGVVSRLVLLSINEAARLVQRGVPAETVDNAMQWGANHPMGPLRLADFVGLDVVLDNLDNLHRLEGDPRFDPATLLRDHVTAGRLGKKSGRGFFAY